ERPPTGAGQHDSPLSRLGGAHPGGTTDVSYGGSVLRRTSWNSVTDVVERSRPARGIARTRTVGSVRRRNAAGSALQQVQEPPPQGLELVRVVQRGIMAHHFPQALRRQPDDRREPRVGVLGGVAAVPAPHRLVERLGLLRVRGGG